MSENFIKRGYCRVEENEVADIYIINTCTVTNLSDRKSRQYIRRAKRLNSNSIIAVVGCYAQVSPEEVAAMKDVDIVIGTTERNKIVDLCEEFWETRQQINIVRDISDDKNFQDIKINEIDSMSRAYIKVQDGCNMFCSYCIIPYARGNIRSRSIDDCVREVQSLSEKGYKEVVLTGIHIASYGYDLGKDRLVDLIEEIAKTDIKRIRLSSVDPRIVTDDFIKRINSTNKVCDHFHLSLQNGSDRILKLMNRRYDTEEFYRKAQIIKTYYPDAGLTTDIIVGFPTENDEDFEKTLKFVEKIGFSRIHVFKYSPRRGTPAAEMKGQVDGNIKHLRSGKLIEKSRRLSEIFANKLIGKSFEVLFEEENEDYFFGYTSNYIRVKAKKDGRDLTNKIFNVIIKTDEEPCEVELREEI
ncbi:tRNA (N(6)-L-threonylcarbamoyladenosine(37)-C(2))-methylthiotransferase MtaB [Peptoniphilus sp. GNH]|nr:tRNA (N(6)-L-threonylcarbamoyladenosine(37)-C(2))-methylthiotransferase MtaB [Peptoniphilus sp. GNH]